MQIIIIIALIIVYLLIAGVFAKIWEIDKKEDKYDDNTTIYMFAGLWPIYVLALPCMAIGYIGYYITGKIKQKYNGKK